MKSSDLLNAREAFLSNVAVRYFVKTSGQIQNFQLPEHQASLPRAL
jgi:hypothetical protein